MAKKKSQRISYVLPLASTPGGHRLGVNGLSFDHDRSVLYTGGRDGVICAWNLDLNAAYDPRGEKSLPSTRTTASFRRQVQAHTHWVNDIVLVKNNLAIVSASSDASVKLWRPHSQDAFASYSIGSHSDYIKCLTTPDRTANWVASGGLDHRICLWDLAGGGQTLEINLKKVDNIVKGSIYSLKARGSVIASGGPEGVVRVWDVNSGKSITKLVGHTDNVRDILISDDGDTILSASSDQTIKVWSMAAGRCLHTLTMHNDSVWCMYSDDPTLSVFYSGDKSGLVAKTDTRRAMEIDDGVSTAICQEHDGITRISVAGNSVWTATSNSSINRWLDVDTELEVETPPASPRHERRPSTLHRNIRSASQSSSSSPSQSTNSTLSEDDETSHTPLKKIPHNAILRLSNTAIHPGRKHDRSFSTTNLRKASEVMVNPDVTFIIPVRGHPEETIQGHNGLTKHVMLNDKKRVLTIDTAGEVLLWDLMKCVPIKSFGRKHLDEVVPEVNTTESIANWCTVDTKTGMLTVMLEEKFAFDAEVYTDDLDIAEQLDLREDQRINLGRWVLRNLFTTLLEEEIRRDEAYKITLKEKSVSAGGISRLGAPKHILLPSSQAAAPMVSPGTVVTPRPGNPTYPFTPGLAIGLATPGGPSITLNGLLSPSAQSEGGHELEKQTAHQSQIPPIPEIPRDYFSTSTNAAALNQPAQTPSGTDGAPTSTQESNPPILIPTSPTDDKKKGLFGKKFQMSMTFPKKLGRNTGETIKSPSAIVEEKIGESDASEKEEASTERIFEDNFFGVVERIRDHYHELIEGNPDQPLPVGIIPSPPMETPVLRPPPHTLVLIQEDNPESGGLIDQYRGEISELGKEANTLEKIAPHWLGNLILRNQLPEKDPTKISFVLLPFEDKLPALCNPNDLNARLNANRMLRAKKIITYVSERIEAPPAPQPQQQPPTSSTTSTDPPNQSQPATNTSDSPAQPSATENSHPQTTTQSESQSQPDPPLRPEEYLELLCRDQKVDPNMTLATLRVHIWRMNGDIVLYYRANGRKQIRIPHPADVAGRDEGMGTLVTAAPAAVVATTAAGTTAGPGTGAGGV